MRSKPQDWTPEDENLIRDFIATNKDRGISVKDVAALFPSRSFTCVKQRIYVLGLQTVGNKDWTPEEDTIIREFYPVMSARDVAAKLPGRNLNAVKARANLLGIIKRVVYEKDEKFFETPNIVNCAVAGFIAADGNLREDDKRMTIRISTKDLEFLKSLVSLIRFNGPVLFQTVNRKAYISEVTGSAFSAGACEMCYICVTCDQWYHDLGRHWNITPRKTATLMPPNLTDNRLKLAFISGEICGDGWISKTVNDSGYLSFGFGVTGTRELLEWIRATINNLIPNMAKKQLSDNKSPNCRDYCLWGATFYWLAKLFLSLDIPRLNRKWDIAREFVERVESGRISTKMKNQIAKKRPTDATLIEFGLDPAHYPAAQAIDAQLIESDVEDVEEILQIPV